MTEDYDALLSRAETDKDGNKINRITLDGLTATDEKSIGTRLQEIAKNATTGGLYTRIGELYGFPIYVISEPTLKDGVSATQNRFVVEGHYKYRYNNGQVAMADTKAAAMNFLNALERIPQIMDQYKAKNETHETNLPVLQEVAGKTWRKEDELKGLKSELAALDRKIQLELAPLIQETGQEQTEGIKQNDGKEEHLSEAAKSDVSDDYIRNHILVVRPGISDEPKVQSRGMKI